MYRRILIAVDKGPAAQRAVEAAVELADQLHARLMVVHVVDNRVAWAPETGMCNIDVLTEMRAEGERLLTRTLSLMPPSMGAQTRLVEGEPATGILTAAAQWPADLIVMGTERRGRLAQFLLGSTADAVMKQATCPVVVVHNPCKPASSVTREQSHPATEPARAECNR